MRAGTRSNRASRQGSKARAGIDGGGRPRHHRPVDVLTALLVELIVIAILFEVARRLSLPYPALFVLGGLVARVRALDPAHHPRARPRAARVPAAAAVRRRVRDAVARPADEHLADRPVVGRAGAADDGHRRRRRAGARPRARLGGRVHARRHRRADGRARGDLGVPAPRRAAHRPDLDRGRGAVQRRLRVDPLSGRPDRDDLRHVRAQRRDRQLRDRVDRWRHRSASSSAGSRRRSSAGSTIRRSRSWSRC